MEKRFHQLLREKMDAYVHNVYRVSKNFPREEQYGATSQLRRATLSVVLNYIEGFARRKRLVKINFFEISFGSLQESKYLLSFALKENWIKEYDHDKTMLIAGEISAMLWKTLTNLDMNTLHDS